MTESSTHRPKSVAWILGGALAAAAIVAVVRVARPGSAEETSEHLLQQCQNAMARLEKQVAAA